MVARKPVNHTSWMAHQTEITCVLQLSVQSRSAITVIDPFGGFVFTLVDTRVKRTRAGSNAIQLKVKLNNISKVDSGKHLEPNPLYLYVIYLCRICLNPLYPSGSALRVCPAWSLCYCEDSVGTGSFVIGMSQISSLFSLTISVHYMNFKHPERIQSHLKTTYMYLFKTK